MSDSEENRQKIVKTANIRKTKSTELVRNVGIRSPVSRVTRASTKAAEAVRARINKDSEAKLRRQLIQEKLAEQRKRIEQKKKEVGNKKSNDKEITEQQKLIDPFKPKKNLVKTPTKKQLEDTNQPHTSAEEKHQVNETLEESVNLSEYSKLENLSIEENLQNLVDSIVSDEEVDEETEQAKNKRTLGSRIKSTLSQTIPNLIKPKHIDELRFPASSKTSEKSILFAPGNPLENSNYSALITLENSTIGNSFPENKEKKEELSNTQATPKRDEKTESNSSDTEESYSTTETEMAVQLSESDKVQIIRARTDSIDCWDGYKVENFIREIEDAAENLNEELEQDFIRTIRQKLRGKARKEITGVTFETIDGMIDWLRETFGVTKNKVQLEAGLSKVVRGKYETIREYASRIKQAAEDLRQAELTDTMSDENRAFVKNMIEEKAVIQFKMGLKNQVMKGALRGITRLSEIIKEAIKFERELAENTEDDEEKSSDNEEAKRKETKPTRKINTCQRCMSTKHEAMKCVESPCIYCGNTTHKSIECQVIPAEAKGQFKCKNCGSLEHTMDFCKKAENNKRYCQFCQAVNHQIVACQMINTVKYCDKCHNPGHEGSQCASVNAAQMQNSNQRQQGPGQPIICRACGKSGHIARNCRSTGGNISQGPQYPQGQNMGGNNFNSPNQNNARNFNPNVNQSNNAQRCYGCNQPGHRIAHCPNNTPMANQGSMERCQLCDRNGHNARNCRTGLVKCGVCGRQGHIAANCRNQGQSQAPNNFNNQPNFQMQNRGNFNQNFNQGYNNFGQNQRNQYTNYNNQNYNPNYNRGNNLNQSRPRTNPGHFQNNFVNQPDQLGIEGPPAITYPSQDQQYRNQGNEYCSPMQGQSGDRGMTSPVILDA